MTLYGVPTLPRLRGVCGQAGTPLEYRLELVRPCEETNTPALIALSPNAKIPVLIDGDLTLWESLPSTFIYIIRAPQGGYGLTRHPNIYTWIERCEAREARKHVRTEIDAYTPSQQEAG